MFSFSLFSSNGRAAFFLVLGVMLRIFKEPGKTNEPLTVFFVIYIMGTELRRAKIRHTETFFSGFDLKSALQICL